jgi:hypothetical protein
MIIFGSKKKGGSACPTPATSLVFMSARGHLWTRDVTPVSNASNLTISVPADGTGAAAYTQRRLRCVPDLWAPSGKTLLATNMQMWRRAQNAMGLKHYLSICVSKDDVVPAALERRHEVKCSKRARDSCRFRKSLLILLAGCFYRKPNPHIGSRRAQHMTGCSPPVRRPSPLARHLAPFPSTRSG